MVLILLSLISCSNRSLEKKTKDMPIIQKNAETTASHKTDSTDGIEDGTEIDKEKNNQNKTWQWLKEKVLPTIATETE